MTRLLCSIAVACLAALGARSANATVLSPGSIVAGHSIAYWTEGWWIRYWQYPFAQIDPNTQNIPATGYNNGPVFYVPTTSGNPALRHVTISFSVPFGRPILVPVFPFDDLEAASIDGDAPLADREHAADVVEAGALASVIFSSVFASIDGTAVSDPTNYLESTGYFSAGLPQPGSLAAVAGVALDDELFPNKAVGYWLMIEGLTLGHHTLDFGGQSVQYTPEPNCCTNFAIGPFFPDVTANISVVPEPSSALLAITGLLGLFAFGRKLSIALDAIDTDVEKELPPPPTV